MVLVKVHARCFVFALFNKPFRKINRGQLLTVLMKGLKVEVCFSIGKDEYRVFRGAKPNLFEVYKNNKMVDHMLAQRHASIWNKPSSNLTTKFTQVVILGSSIVPFMQLGASVRREVIEDYQSRSSHMNTFLKIEFVIN